jgi:hypothetical protein
MAKFTAVVTYTFDTEYEFEAENQEEAEQEASFLSREWLPYSSEKGYTDSWVDVDMSVYTDEDLFENE